MPYDLAIPGWSTRQDLEAIEEIAAGVPEGGLAVEVGVLYGRTAYAWACSIPPSATLHCIDMWQTEVPADPSIMAGDIPKDRPLTHDIKYFLANVGGLPNVRYTVGHSHAVLPTFAPRSIDMLFIDDWHRNPIFARTLEIAVPLIAPGGVLCGHDFSMEFGDVVTEVVKMARTLRRPIEFVGAEHSSIWLMRL